MGSIKLKVVYRVASLIIFFSHSQAPGGRELILIVLPATLRKGMSSIVQGMTWVHGYTHIQ